MSDAEEQGRGSRALAALEPLRARLRIVLPAAWLVVAVSLWGLFGPGVGLLALAAGALLGAIAALWNSVRAVFGETQLSREDAYAIGAPSTEEEQKRAVLRAIKDLEFEHGVGKISDEDYEQLMGRYRAEAKRLLQLIDDRARPERARAERLAARYLRERGVEPGWEVGAEGREESPVGEETRSDESPGDAGSEASRDAGEAAASGGRDADEADAAAKGDGRDAEPEGPPSRAPRARDSAPRGRFDERREAEDDAGRAASEAEDGAGEEASEATEPGADGDAARTVGDEAEGDREASRRRGESVEAREEGSSSEGALA